MRPHQIIAGMSPEEFEQLMEAIREESPEAMQSTTVAAAQLLKFRPKFLLKQPLKKRLGSIKSAMSRLMANSLAEEILAVYFLRCRKDLLCEWLDTMGLEHEDGILTQDEVPCPEAAELETKVGTFRGVDDSPDRELLLKVFSGQSAIDWPALDAMIEA
ncbi:MAG: hypothetical protein ACKVIW_13180 [bacterium]|jgi:hypothetical protein